MSFASPVPTRGAVGVGVVLCPPAESSEMVAMTEQAALAKGHRHRRELVPSLKRAWQQPTPRTPTPLPSQEPSPRVAK